MNDLQAKLDYADAVTNWFLDSGRQHAAEGDLEAAMKCAFVAANLLSRQNRKLSSGRLEEDLRYIAYHLPEPANAAPRAAAERVGKRVCLHVLSEALPVGGITSMATRWMQNDGTRIHSMALFSGGAVPEVFREAVRKSGGVVYRPDPGSSLTRTAAWLRHLAREKADVVVLHLDVSDVICGAAFGEPGGPPVLLINYNAHIFWTGARIADLVVNIRGSALEEIWTGVYRGVSRYATIPVPLEERYPGILKTTDFIRKQEARRRLRISDDAIVILTVGASFKYQPCNGLDFIETCEEVLELLPRTCLLAAGFEGDERWKSAEERWGSRIRTLGTLSPSRLAEVRDTADIYVEGFPFGTTASLLEAGRQGIPVVLAPAQCPPPYGTDGVALDHILVRPATVEEFQTKVIALCTDPVGRSREGERLAASILRHHTGGGWRRYLDAAMTAVPREHHPQPSITPVRTPEEAHEYWATFVSTFSARYEESLESAVDLALAQGLKPHLTWAAVRRFRAYRSVRHGRTVPFAILVPLVNVLFPVLPPNAARAVFRICSFLGRGRVFNRLRRKLFGRQERSGRSWYGEYKNFPDEEKREEHPQAA